MPLAPPSASGGRAIGSTACGPTAVGNRRRPCRRAAGRGHRAGSDPAPGTRRQAAAAPVGGRPSPSGGRRRVEGRASASTAAGSCRALCGPVVPSPDERRAGVCGDDAVASAVSSDRRPSSALTTAASRPFALARRSGPILRAVFCADFLRRPARCRLRRCGLLVAALCLAAAVFFAAAFWAALAGAVRFNADFLAVDFVAAAFVAAASVPRPRRGGFLRRRRHRPLSGRLAAAFLAGRLAAGRPAARSGACAPAGVGPGAPAASTAGPPGPPRLPSSPARSAAVVEGPARLFRPRAARDGDATWGARSRAGPAVPVDAAAEGASPRHPRSWRRAGGSPRRAVAPPRRAPPPARRRVPDPAGTPPASTSLRTIAVRFSRLASAAARISSARTPTCPAILPVCTAMLGSDSSPCAASIARARVSSPRPEASWT